MLATLVALMLTVGAPAPDTIVVCPAAFRPALTPWLNYRTAQGRSIAIVSNLGRPDEIRRQIRELAQGGKLKYIVLVGDADPRLYRDPEVRTRCVPAHYAKAEISVLWGSEPYLPTDNWYADLDDDQSPDVAIGRLSADTPQELSVVVEKILAYENSRDFGVWRRQVNVVAGVGGFGALADSMLESAARYFLTRDVPQGYATGIAYGSWHSPFCPDPRRFHQATLERLDEGSLFWVYIGHGYHLGLDYIHAPNAEYPILDVNDADRLRCRHGAPVALFMACYTGAFDASDDCLAERLLRSRGGPVAVLAGTRVTMPYAMAVLSTGLMQECFQQRTATLGEAFLHAKQRMIHPTPTDDAGRAMLDAVAMAISPSKERLAAERAEHVLLFNLLGDPLLQLNYPKSIELTAEPAIAGQTLTLSASAPVAGRCTVELVPPRGTLTFTPPTRNEFPANESNLSQMHDVYHRANDGRLATVEKTVDAGRFTVDLAIPANLQGRHYVRLFIEGRSDCAQGAKELEIRPAAVAAKGTQGPR